MEVDARGETPLRTNVFVALLCSRLFWPSIVALSMEIVFVCLRSFIGNSYDLVAGVLALLCVLAAFGVCAKTWTDSLNEKYSTLSVTAVSAVVRLSVILITMSALFAFAYTAVLKAKYAAITSRGVFGDAFGALNAIVSTASLIGLWMTVWLQHRQIQEDRRIAAFERRSNEEKRNEDRRNERRRHWPAVVIDKLDGFVKLVGVGEDGKASFRFVFDVCQKNCSDQVLINVVQNLQTSRDLGNEYIVNLFTEVISYVDRDKPINAAANFLETSFGGDDTIRALSKVEKRVVHVNIYIGTVQKYYYFISQQYEVQVLNEAEKTSILTPWVDALAIIKERIAKKMEGEDFNKLLLDVLRSKGINLDAKLRLGFTALPSRYTFVEISEAEYVRALEKRV